MNDSTPNPVVGSLRLVAGDTDGLALKKPDERPFTDEERSELVRALNATMDEMIRWEDDGVYKRQIVVKTKNYILQDEKGKVKLKGSALKATTKEKALQRFIGELVELLLAGKNDRIYALYMKYAEEIVSLTDITDWCMKKTVTKAVLNPERTNEQNVADAIGDADVSEGDKVYVFYKSPKELCLREEFDGAYDAPKLLGKLYDTLAVFETILDIKLIPDLTLKRNQDMIPPRRIEKPVLCRPKPSMSHLPTNFFTRGAS